MLISEQTATAADTADAIYPTHTCFDDALELIGALRDPRARLVHAIVEPEGSDGPFAHAWVELGKRALWSGILRGQRRTFASDANAYRQNFRARDVTEYTCYEAARENRVHLTYGPWQQRYLDLCRQTKDKVVTDANH